MRRRRTARPKSLPEAWVLIYRDEAEIVQVPDAAGRPHQLMADVEDTLGLQGIKRGTDRRWPDVAECVLEVGVGSWLSLFEDLKDEQPLSDGVGVLDRALAQEHEGYVRDAHARFE